MKFKVELSHLCGYLRSGEIQGEFSPEEYEEWLSLDPHQQREMLLDYGTIVPTSYCIETVGELGSLEIL